MYLNVLHLLLLTSDIRQTHLYLQAACLNSGRRNTQIWGEKASPHRNAAASCSPAPNLPSCSHSAKHRATLLPSVHVRNHWHRKQHIHRQKLRKFSWVVALIWCQMLMPACFKGHCSKCTLSVCSSRHYMLKPWARKQTPDNPSTHCVSSVTQTGD